MKTDNQMPGKTREYPESDISDNQKQSTNQEQQGQSPNNDDEAKEKGNPTYIKDMPEIKPARPGVM
jgi:hypothetical protein